MDEKNKKELENVKRKVLWRLENKEMDSLVYGDGEISTVTGNMETILNTLSNMIWQLRKAGVPKIVIKTCVKQGLRGPKQ